MHLLNGKLTQLLTPGGHNLPPLVGTGLTEPPNLGWAKAYTAQTLTASMKYEKD